MKILKITKTGFTMKRLHFGRRYVKITLCVFSTMNNVAVV